MNNKMTGYGVMKWPDGKIYEGNFKNDLKNGFGKLTTVEGKVYEGNWLNGKFNNLDFKSKKNYHSILNDEEEEGTML